MINLFNIKRNNKFPFIHVSQNSFYAIFLISLFLGVFGWIFETTIEMFFSQIISDRGFLCGPFIPIYFVFSFFALLTFNIPTKTFKNFIKFFFIYGILVTILEFVVGNLVEYITGAVLWDYDHFPLSKDYISLPVSIIWGIGCSLYVMFVVPYLYKIYLNMSLTLKSFIGVSFIILFSSDLTITILDMIKHGRYRKKYNHYIDNKLMSILLFDEVLFVLFTVIFYLLLHKIKINKTYLSILFNVLYMIPIIYTIIYLQKS